MATTDPTKRELRFDPAQEVDITDYQFGFRDEEDYFFKSEKGLSPEVVRKISEMKDEPEWMLDFRLKALDYFNSRPMPDWGADLSGIDFDDIYYYIRPSEKQGKSWDEIPAYIKETFDKLGIPEAEKKYLAGVGAQYESEVVYHSLREDLEEMGVVFLDMDSGLREYPELVKQYFGTIIPANDNKFAALNSAVWSGGSFVYVPKGVKVDVPLQAYFRINAENMGQFERTLIICEPDSYVHYVEGCTALIYSTDRCTASSRSSSRTTRAAATRRSRTGLRTSTILSPSAPPPTRTPPWNGSTATSARR
ncbi:MAG: Fe-S cluster assembly protein SufB [Thermomicrobiales bacterium]